MNLVVVVSPARIQANNDKLYFEYPPSSNILNEPAQEKPQSKESIGDKINEVTAENVKVLYGPRHDEFDWDLTKVSSSFLEMFKSF